jgi:hypothetical protein
MKNILGQSLEMGSSSPELLECVLPFTQVCGVSDYIVSKISKNIFLFLDFTMHFDLII